MKQAPLLSVLLLSLALFASCSEEGIDIDFHDPQHVVFIHGEDDQGHVLIDQDLVEAFGEEYIHFGHTPPNLEDISFKIQGMDYVSCVRYIFNIDPSQPPILSHTDPPTFDGSTNYHHFYHHTENLATHKCKTIDTYNNAYLREINPVYVIGDTDTISIGNTKLIRFTVYYEEELQENDSGHPTNAFLISGTLVYDDQDHFMGIKDYRMGKKILRYKERPVTPSYAQGTIEIKTHSAFSPKEDWDF